MVSPVDKNNADIITLLNQPELPARSNRSSSDGEKLTYSAYKAFGDAIASPYSTQYMASRSPRLAGGPLDLPAAQRRDPQRLAWRSTPSSRKASARTSARGWFFQDTDLSLAPEAVPGFPNLYKADLCGSGGYEAITRVAPPERAPSQYTLRSAGHLGRRLTHGLPGQRQTDGERAQWRSA